MMFSDVTTDESLNSIPSRLNFIILFEEKCQWQNIYANAMTPFRPLLKLSHTMPAADPLFTKNPQNLKFFSRKASCLLSWTTESH